MNRTTTTTEQSKPRIHTIDVTSDTLSDRGGLALFARYLTTVGALVLLGERFGALRKSGKGSCIEELFKQVLCFLFDGTSRHLSSFDRLKADVGYAGIIEMEKLDSSHSVKRFFRGFWLGCGCVFRKVLHELFVWRLQIKQPELIELTIDSMVMNNDEAQVREGVEPTYKKVKGFQPLHAIWEGKIVDALFRNGKKNGNSGEGAVNMVRTLVRLIRERYDEHTAIVVRLDAGFFDQKLFAVLDQLGVGFICSGKMYPDVKECVGQVQPKQWYSYRSGKYEWEYTEWDYQAGSWKRPYRALYTRPVYEQGQGLLEFARPDNVIVTNLGMNEELSAHCSEELDELLESPDYIIRSHHLRGADELPHRGLKDFGSEQLPFKRFAANTAFYYCMVIGFFLFETFKEDVLSEILPALAKSYPTTVRRQLVDIAAKLVRTSGRIILKITQAAMERLQFAALWRKAQQAPAMLC